MISWPLASIGEGGTSPVTATSAYVAPVRQLQGVATDGTYYYLSAECPVGYMGDARPGDTLSYSCVYQAKPGGRATVLTRAPATEAGRRRHLRRDHRQLTRRTTNPAE